MRRLDFTKFAIGLCPKTGFEGNKRFQRKASSMITTASIAFREFFWSIFNSWRILRNLKKAEIEKRTGNCTGSSHWRNPISFVIDNNVCIWWPCPQYPYRKNAELLESYLLIFSGLFIAYVVFSLHNVLRRSRRNTLTKAHQKLQQNVFDVSLFFTIIFLVLREGFEIALFTSSVSLFSAFILNFIGLILGFGVATYSYSISLFLNTSIGGSIY